MSVAKQASYDTIMKRLFVLEAEINDLKNKSGQINIKTTTSFNDAINRFVYSPWCYGSSRIMSAKGIFFKMMWFVAILCVTVGCFYFIQNIISDYLNYDTVTQSETIFKEELEFPRVVICQYSPETIDLMEAIVSCRFNNEIIIDKIGNISVSAINGNNANCIKIDLSKNSEDRMKQKKFDSYTAGLQLGMDTSVFKSEYVLVVYVLDSFAMPISFMPDAILEENTWNIAYLDWTNEKRLPLPYSNCINDFSDLEKTSDLVANTIKYNSFYQKSKCIYLCKFKFIAEHFNCSYPGLYETDSSTNCSDASLEETHDNGPLSKQNNCSDLCPNECETNTYKLTKEKTFKDNLTTNRGLADSNIEFYLTYFRQEMTLRSHRPKTLGSDLISKLGGTFGIFIGAKLLSLVDIFEFFLEICSLTIKKILN